MHDESESDCGASETCQEQGKAHLGKSRGRALATLAAWRDELAAAFQHGLAPPRPKRKENSTVSRPCCAGAHFRQSEETSFAMSDKREPMHSQKAIFVPGHGVPEVIRSVRLMAKLESSRRVVANAESPQSVPAELELWHGDFYGWHPGENPKKNSTPARIPAVFAEGNLPVIAPGKSMVAVVRHCPNGWEVEIESEFTNRRGELVQRTVTFDDWGTARERLSGPGALSGDSAVPRGQPGEFDRTTHVPGRLERFWRRLKDSTAAGFHHRADGPPSPKSLVPVQPTGRDDARFDLAPVSTETRKGTAVSK